MKRWGHWWFFLLWVCSCVSTRLSYTKSMLPVQSVQLILEGSCWNGWRKKLRRNQLSLVYLDTHTHTHPCNGPLSGTTRVSRYQKGKTTLDFTEARDSEWQWHQLAHVQVCTSLQTDNHASTPPLSFLQAECPSCRQTSSIKGVKAVDSGW